MCVPTSRPVRTPRQYHGDRLHPRNITLLQQNLLVRTIQTHLLYHRGPLNASLLRQISLLGRIVRSLLQHHRDPLYLLNIPLWRQSRLLCRTRRAPLLCHSSCRYSQNIPPSRQILALLQILCPSQYLCRVTYMGANPAFKETRGSAVELNELWMVHLR
jgi:hypothetical protein